MDPVSALIGVGGSILGGLIGTSGQQKTNIANAKQAQLNRDFQERMSSTAHQREVKDLRAAGLNPILSASKGASSPGGAQATMQNALEPLANSAKESAMQAAQIGLLKAQTRKTNNDADVTEPKATVYKEIADLITGGISGVKDAIGSYSAKRLEKPTTIAKPAKPRPEPFKPINNAPFKSAWSRNKDALKYNSAKKVNWMNKNGYTWTRQGWKK